MAADSTPVRHRRDHWAAAVTRQRRQLPSEWRRLVTPAGSSSSSSSAAAALAARPRSRRPTYRTVKAARGIPEERGRCATGDAPQKAAGGGGTKTGSRRRGVQQGRCRTEPSSGGEGRRDGRGLPLLPLLPLLLVLLLVHVSSPRDQGGWGLIPGASAELRPESDLTSNCFDFPANNFDRENSIKAVNGGNTPYLPLTVGEDAVDFTLHDLKGRRWNLGETLERTGLPVVMVWGMFTCPAFQGYGTYPPWDKCGYRDEYDLVEAYGGKATFVHLYGPEPHPAMPGTNFDIGTTWQAFWSVFQQATRYEERVAMAQRIGRRIHPSQDILVDYLPGNPYSELIQPVWCSYSMGARPVTVVSPDGKLFFQRGWFHSEHVGRAIDEYWCQQEQQQEEEAEALRRRGGDSPLRQRDRLRQEEGGGLGGFHGTAGGGEGPPPGEREGGPAATVTATAGGVGSSSSGGAGGGYVSGSDIFSGAPRIASWTSCLSAEEGTSDTAGDMGEPGIPPLAGVLTRRGEEGPSSSTPPW